MATQPMAMFTLAQKVFTVKMYYQEGGNAGRSLAALHKRFGIRANEHNLAIVIRIIRAFETTGNVLQRFYYNLKDETVTRPPPMAATKTRTATASTVCAPPEIPVKSSSSPVPVIEMQFLEFVDDDLIVEESVTVKDELQDSFSMPGSEAGDSREDDDESESNLIEAAAAAEQTAPSNTSTSKPDDSSVRHSLCSECGASVPNRLFRSHMQSHKEPKPKKEQPTEFPCQYCPLKFRYKSTLHGHTKKHLPNQHYICEVCAKVSYSKGTHQNHMLCHSDEKPYQCKHCPMAFRRRQGLRRHEMAHTGEKPLKCPDCGAGFLAHMTLNMHMRLHTGERPFACQHCDQRFIGKPALNSHLKKHHREEYLYECGLCGGRFKTEATMRVHMEKKHNIAAETEIVLKAD